MVLHLIQEFDIMNKERERLEASIKFGDLLRKQNQAIQQVQKKHNKEMAELLRGQRDIIQAFQRRLDQIKEAA